MKPNEKYDKTIDKFKNKFEQFQSSLNGQKKSVVNEIRQDAIKKLEEVSFPTGKHEEWKYTNVAPLLKEDFTPVFGINEEVEESIKVESLFFSGFKSNKLVFINGVFSEKHSNIIEKYDNIIIDSLENYSKKEPEFVKENLSRIEIENGFDAVNTAFVKDGAFIRIPKGKMVEFPIQILYLNGAKKENVLSMPRNQIIAEDGTSAKIISIYKPIAETKYFTNSQTDIFTGSDSNIEFYKFQIESEKSYHIDHLNLYQEKNSVLTSHSYAIGGSLVRNNISAIINDEESQCNLYGLYLGNKKQHIDNHTFIDHAKPNCESNELYKGIMDESAQGVFSGKILVRENAQKTNAYQSNKSILLSDTASVDTKPQLEIYADDVKCSHGATVGQLDKDAFFYLRSRGIPPKIANSMLIGGFVDDVLSNISIEEIKEQITHLIFEHLHKIEV